MSKEKELDELPINYARKELMKKLILLCQELEFNPLIEEFTVSVKGTNGFFYELSKAKEEEMP